MASFDEVLKDCTKLGTKIPTSEYLESGKYPIIDQGQNDIAGYYDSDDGLFEDVPTIVFGDHTRVVKYVDKPCFLGADGVKLLCPLDKDINCKYLFYQLSCADIPNTGYNRHFKWVKALDFKIPSSDEQNHVVEVLDKVTELISLRKQQLFKLDELVKARFVEMFGDPVYNEMHWETKRLIDICRTIVDCPHSTPHYTTKDTGYKCIRTSAVKKNKILWEKVECISKQEYEERIKRKRPEKGDVIYTREGAILGIAAVIDRDYNVALGQRSMLLSPDIYKCTPCFLSMAMNFDSFLGKALGGVSGSASPHINVGDIKALEIIAPPSEIQNQFSTFVEQVDQQKQTVQQSLEKLELLKKALMQEYFGELPQSPDGDSPLREGAFDVAVPKSLPP